MPSVEEELDELMARGNEWVKGVFGENHADVSALDMMKAAIETGAVKDTNPNGSPKDPFGPMALAAIAGDASHVEFLLEQGADPDRPVKVDLPCSDSGKPMALAGKRPLHIAARTGKVDVVRVLLKQPRADPNVTDYTGCTPLFATCEDHPDNCKEVVGLLLEAGADPALAEERGTTPLMLVALKGDMDVVDMLHAAAPAMLNRWASKGETALFGACAGGHEGVVSRLLSLGAKQTMPPAAPSMCPLAMAVSRGHASVVRILIEQGGIRAIGGDIALPQALYMAIRVRVRGKFASGPTILRLLLTIKREKRRPKWVNTKFNDGYLLHDGAGCCCPAAVSFLLEAGADEAKRDSEGRIPKDVIGLYLDEDDKVKMTRGKAVAIHRMLQRGPAYRARSWAWPSDENEADAGGCGNGESVAGVAGGAGGGDDAVVLSSPPAVKIPPVIGARIFRPRKGNTQFFVRLIGRYCVKN